MSEAGEGAPPKENMTCQRAVYIGGHFILQGGKGN